MMVTWNDDLKVWVWRDGNVTVAQYASLEELLCCLQKELERAERRYDDAMDEVTEAKDERDALRRLVQDI